MQLHFQYSDKLTQLTDTGNADALHDVWWISNKAAMEKRGISQLAILIVPPAIQHAPDDKLVMIISVEQKWAHTEPPVPLQQKQKIDHR